MAAANGDVVDPQVALVAAAQLEDLFLRSGSDNMNNSTGVLFLVQGLEHHVVASLLFVLNQVELLIAGLDHKGVRLFANFALKGLPEERTEVD